MPSGKNPDPGSDDKTVTSGLDVPRPAPGGIGGVKGHHIKRNYLAGRPRPATGGMRGELHKVDTNLAHLGNKLYRKYGDIIRRGAVAQLGERHVRSV